MNVSYPRGSGVFNTFSTPPQEGVRELSHRRKTEHGVE